MPSVSKAQNRFMQGCEHSRAGMGAKCPPKKVAHEFNQATKSTKGLPERVGPKKR